MKGNFFCSDFGKHRVLNQWHIAVLIGLIRVLFMESDINSFFFHCVVS